MRAKNPLTYLNPSRSEEIAADIARIFVLEGRHAEAPPSVEGLSDGENRDAVLAVAWSGPGQEAEARTAIARLTAEGSFSAAFYLADAHAEAW